MLAVAMAVGGAESRAATLTARDSELQAGEVASIIVDGTIAGEPTFGITVLVEIVARAGNRGTVGFTEAPPTDIAIAGHPWFGAGAVSKFDTDQTGSVSLNGVVYDNGTFLPAPVSFDGILAVMPIVVSADASGTWDVILSTSVGDSAWEGVPTVLQAAVVFVPSMPRIPAVSTWGLWIMALLTVTAGSLLTRRRFNERVPLRDLEDAPSSHRRAVLRSVEDPRR